MSEYESLKKRATWELKNQQKALNTIHGFFNTEEENKTLELINKILKERK